MRRVIIGTRKHIKDLIGDSAGHTQYIGRVRNVEVKPLVFDETPALPGYLGNGTPLVHREDTVVV